MDEFGEINGEFCIGLIPPTNLIILNLSKIVNIESIRWIIHARNISGKIWILLSIISFICGLYNFNNNFLKTLINLNRPYQIGVTGYSNYIIGMLDYFGHTIVATNKILL